MNTSKRDVSVVVLAAGLGTRFKSNRAKLLHPIAGKPLGRYLLDTVRQLTPQKIYMIVGHQADQVREALAGPDLEFVPQKQQLGTGHALQIAQPYLEKDTAAHVLVLVGDVPLIRKETLEGFLDAHRKQRAAGSVLSVRLDDPAGYGRVVRRGRAFLGVVEEKNCTPAQKKIREISTGILCFDRKKLLAHIGRLSNKNPQGEYLLPDLLTIFRRKKFRLHAFEASDPEEVEGVNDRAGLARAEKRIRRRKLESLMQSGVSVIDPDNTYVDPEVEIGPDTVVEPGVSLLGETRIGADCLIRSYSTLQNCRVGDRTVIRPCCYITETEIASDALIGPFAHLRDGTRIEAEARVGNFVEIKKSTVGRGTKAAHLTYLGDATLGENVNIGAGTVTCNYDGKKKFPTHIEDGTFIGSGSMLVAPIRIGKNAYVAAGSTVTKDVPDGALSIGRAHQVNKEGWAEKQKDKEAGAPGKPSTPPSTKEEKS
ncbi:MAG: bifunctional UDP-N-acetylglucosamine diphosphorylase/glucosamine-1-phosphate N-acetyltransferase GlmU [Acidobacteria bacterium]|nr:bifunctional UDP-N-acetylglucosamine diphosphorylase/glucosamine-1-phosphate N-acetyltransferase GlmU [Acidobacteriota bacterium]